MKIDLDDLASRAQNAAANWLLESIAAPLPQETLALIAIARAAQVVRNARRDGLRGDHEQDVHEELARVLDAAGLGERPGEQLDQSVTMPRRPGEQA